MIEIPEPRWAVVEIMGHRTRAGAISDVIIAGKSFLRIEHPILADHTGQEPLEELYSADAIFCIRPCSREVVVEAARYWRAPVLESGPPALSAGFAEKVWDDEDQDVVDDFDDDYELEHP